MSPQKPNFTRRILVVDDDIQLRSMLGLMLDGGGYEVSHAESGPAAIALHSQRCFDLVIIELARGENDGFRTIVELRKQHVPVRLIATVRSNWLPAGQSLRMAEQLGADYILAKPLQPEQLLSVVRRALS